MPILKLKIMKTVIRWLASIFEDKRGTASSKRFIMFGAFFLLAHMVYSAKPVDVNLVYAVVAVLCIFGGYAIGEFFSKPFIK